MYDPEAPQIFPRKSDEAPTTRVRIAYSLEAQIERINCAKTFEEKVWALDAFESMLYPFLRDDKYGLNDEREDITSEIMSKEVVLDSGINPYSGNYLKNDKEKLDAKLQLTREAVSQRYDFLMWCMKKIKMYPTSDVESYETEGEDGVRYGGLQPFYARLRTYVEREQRGVFLFVSGDPGKGKSTACIKIGNEFDKEFSRVWENRICFDVDHALELLNQELLVGSVIILEEGGVNLSSRDWYSEYNKELLKVVNILRFKRCVFMINCRDKNLIDNKVRQFLNFEVEAVRIDRDANRNYLKVKEFSINKMKPMEPMHKYLRTSEGDRRTLFCVIPPPKEQMLAYDRLSEPWKQKIIEEARETIGNIGVSKRTLEKQELDNLFDTLKKEIKEKGRLHPTIKKLGKRFMPDGIYLQGKYGLTVGQARKVRNQLMVFLAEEGLTFQPVEVEKEININF